MNARNRLPLVLLLIGLVTSHAAGPETTLVLAPGPGNPRNSEGDFIRLAQGDLLFVYTRFADGARDNSAAVLASRRSKDGGKTWSQVDRVVVENEAAENVMSVSLLRVAKDRIALIYLRKESWEDCRPWIRFSSDEGGTWGAPSPMIGEREMGYYVLNNDRVVRLESGRLVAPVALHNDPVQKKFDPHARILCYLSDDDGRTWHRSRTIRKGETPEGKVMLQEPGVVEVGGAKVMLFCRTNKGTQYLSWSEDGCETFGAFRSSKIYSPRSPASIERLPGSESLLMAWNDHEGVQHGKRTPLTLALSGDGGKSWSTRRVLHDNPNGWYCYTAMEVVGDHVLLGYCAGDRTQNNGLALSQVTRVPLEWIQRGR